MVTQQGVYFPVRQYCRVPDLFVCCIYDLRYVNMQAFLSWFFNTFLCLYGSLQAGHIKSINYNIMCVSRLINSFNYNKIPFVGLFKLARFWCYMTHYVCFVDSLVLFKVRRFRGLGEFFAHKRIFSLNTFFNNKLWSSVTIQNAFTRLLLILWFKCFNIQISYILVTLNIRKI